MIKELLIFFFTLDQIDSVLFIPAMAIAFVAGVISLAKGVGRYT